MILYLFSFLPVRACRWKALGRMQLLCKVRTWNGVGCGTKHEKSEHITAGEFRHETKQEMHHNNRLFWGRAGISSDKSR